MQCYMVYIEYAQAHPAIGKEAVHHLHCFGCPKSLNEIVYRFLFGWRVYQIILFANMNSCRNRNRRKWRWKRSRRKKERKKKTHMKTNRPFTVASVIVARGIHASDCIRPRRTYSSVRSEVREWLSISFTNNFIWLCKSNVFYETNIAPNRVKRIASLAVHRP